MTISRNVVSSLSTTVNMSVDVNVYIVNALASISYTYNLPTITSDGMNFVITRSDTTTGVVTLMGNIVLNNVTLSSFSVKNCSSVSVLSLGGLWYLYFDTTNASVGINNIFSTSFLGNNGTTFLTLPANSIFMTFPFAGTSNNGTINNITMITDIRFIGSQIIIRDSLLNIIVTITVTAQLFSYNFTPANKSLLPAGFTYIYISTGTLILPNPGIASIEIY